MSDMGYLIFSMVLCGVAVRIYCTKSTGLRNIATGARGGIDGKRDDLSIANVSSVSMSAALAFGSAQLSFSRQELCLVLLLAPDARRPVL